MFQKLKVKEPQSYSNKTERYLSVFLEQKDECINEPKLDLDSPLYDLRPKSTTEEKVSGEIINNILRIRIPFLKRKMKSESKKSKDETKHMEPEVNEFLLLQESEMGNDHSCADSIELAKCLLKSSGQDDTSVRSMYLFEDEDYQSTGLSEV
eukprot:snap_masked-scaffold_10-processed-gene-12.22-mRNA-1 protein AED:1.00 eAED:1.00 QI:0/-1/0/0/-1/1/1/0/151